MDKESILDRKIREQRFPKCFKGDYHDFQDTMCIDERCEDCTFEPMCSFCVQKNLHRKPYHNSKLIKPFIIELLQFLKNEDNLKLKSQAIAEDQAEQIFKIDNLYKNLAKQFQRKGQQCYDIAKQLLNNLDIYHELREDFTQQKTQAIEIIEKIASKDLDSFTLQNSLKKLSKIVTIKNNNLQINIQSIINSIQDLQKQAEIYANVYSDALNRFDVQIKFDQLYQHSYSTTIADNYQEQRIRNKKANITEFDRIKTEIGRSKEDQQELVDFTWMAIKNLKQRIFEKILKTKDLAIEQANSKGNHMNSKFYVNQFNQLLKQMTIYLFFFIVEISKIFLKKKRKIIKDLQINNLVGRCNLINSFKKIYKKLLINFQKDD
ncbi:hypothetical protein TTHERM_00391390 (macronuclear) [Tetrahymena thermophila SB210]|uniref:Uncharacterized protein n=1 Tax=Tetrahymena thermophila (strain SB210) TaxID=312017 RepID=Q233L1_TETTS|nr:hypothetical protein TTHERM_00391390 [Tetrahymena thermophila SB210]EAR91569.2 hypothetical protein TTHERM_00391390 [Tetrahymena thermophila SB210]|eukprot:XP_001011814.2 hypothetical protein TTHERM_00391390 [Tetrahymena thermophila SB210]